MKKIIFIFILVCLFSCNDSPTNQQTEKPTTTIKKVEDFPSEQTLQGEKILADQFYKNGSIAVIDTLLLIGLYQDTVWYNIYGVNSLQHLGTLGTVGNAPEDWNVVFHVNQYEVSQNSILLWFSDVLKGRLLKVNLSKVVEARSPMPIIEKTIDVKVNLFPFNQLIYVSDEKVIGNQNINEVDGGRIKSFNPQKQELIKKVGLFPTLKNAQGVPSPVLYNFYFGTLRKHPSKDVFVQATSLFNRIDFFDTNLELINSIVSGENWKDDYYDTKKMDIMGDPLNGIREGYFTMSVTEDFVYAVSVNKKENAEGRVKESQIKVFDWEGNPKCLISVSDDLLSISVDSNEEYLYAIDYENEKVLRYNIKKLVEEWKK